MTRHTLSSGSGLMISSVVINICVVNPSKSTSLFCCKIKEQTSKVIYEYRESLHIASLKKYTFFFFFNQARTLYQWASLIAQLVKNPPAMQETPVQILGQEDPLEKE